MSNETLKQKSTNINQESIDYEGGKLAYLHINAEQADPANNKLVVIPGFTQGVEVLGDFGEALSQEGNREVFVLDQPEREKRTFDKKLKGEIGINDQVDAFMAFLEQNNLTDEPVDFVASSFGTSILAAAAIKAKELGWKSFDSAEGSNVFFTGASGANPKETIRSLGTRWAKWMAKNAPAGKTLDPNGEMMKAGTQNALGDVKKTLNETIALSKYKIDFEQLEDAGVKPVVIGYADDDLMPFSEVAENLEHMNGAVSLIDNAGNAPSLPGGETMPGAGSYREFKQKTGLKGKEAKSAWLHHYRAAEHNDMQFHPERTARFIGSVLVQKAEKRQK